MKILHLIIDHQVIERALGLFERQFPNSNEVLVFTDTQQLQHLKKYKTCRQISRRNVKKERKLFDFSKYDYIIAHYLTATMIRFLKYSPSTVHICWDIYGADLYNQFLAPMGYKLQYSDVCIYESTFARLLKKIGLYNIALYIKDGSIMQFDFVREKYFRRITDRLDSIEVGCMCDAKLLEQYSGIKYKVFKTFNYSLTETLGELYDTPPFNDNHDILIGNSASLSNNHLYVFDFIKDYNLSNMRIVIPLSYGGTLKYRDAVISRFKNCFPNQIDLIMDYMPLHEYNKIFKRINIMVLASWRQESFGTIIMGLYLGVKIYMSQKSPLLLSLKEEGFLIYEIENTTNDDFVCSLTKEQKLYNRNLLLERYAENVFLEELKRQFV